MNKSLKRSLLAVAVAALPFSSQAAGLGRLNVLSALGQPLNAVIEIQASPDEIASMSARIASPDAFRDANVAYTPVLNLLRMSVERRGDAAVLRLSSERPVSEPFVDLIVEVNWANGRLIREYTFLLDPAAPPAKAISAVTEAPAAVPERRAAPATVWTPPPRAAAPTKSADRSAAAPADQYVVRSGDTLAKIASAHRPEGVSLEQMLVTLLRRNPEAFEDNNINRLKAGRILSIPDATDVASVTQSEARREVVAQAADFAAYRKRLAQAVMTRDATDTTAGTQQSGGLITPKITETPKPGADARDQVRVSKTEMKGPEAGDAARGRLQSLEEDIQARDRALKDANERLADLERNIRELQKLVELKSQNLAEAQSRAEAAKAAPAPAATVVPTPPATAPAPVAPVVAAAPTPPAPAPTPAPTSAPTSAPAVAPPTPVPAAVAPPPKPEPAPAPPAPKPEPAPAPPDSGGGLASLLADPLNLAAGGGLLALLLGWGVYRSRQRREASGSAASSAGAPSEMSMGGGSVFGSSGGQSVDTGSSVIQTDFSQSGMSSIDADEGVDPVAEADVYMAYGRDAQAEEILLDALKADPGRTAVHVKLLEIYAQRKSPSQFESTASDLYSQTGGQGADWERAAAMGRKFDPENPLYSGAGGAAAAMAARVGESIKPTVAKVPAVESSSVPPVIPAIDEMSALDFPLGDESPQIKGANAQLKDTWAMPGELSQFTDSSGGVAAAEFAARAGAPASAEISKSVGSSLDFNLDLGDAPLEEAPVPPTAQSSVEAPVLDFAAFETPVADDGESTIISVPGREDEDLVLADASDSTLEFNLDFGDETPAAPAVSAAAPAPAKPVPVEEDFSAQATSLDTLDFELEQLGAPEAAVPPAATGVKTPPPAMDLTATLAVDSMDHSSGDQVATDLEQSSFDGTLLDFDFELDAKRPAAPADVEATALDLSAIDLDLEAHEGDAAPVTEMAPLAPSEDELRTEIMLPADSPPAADADLADDPEVDTKLELARAYEEMGDKDGARELLEEVLAEGSASQKDQARAVLSRL